ncbi:MAG: TrfB-related DNA-binding protein [Pseudonocardiaceae bacterium]
MSSIATVTAVYERDVQGRWLVHIAEEPRCHTWARSYASARREIGDAAELWLDELGVESIDDLDIRDEVRIPGAAQARELAEAREDLTRRLAEVRTRVDEVARGLVVEGVSVRDVADLLGISPGRVSQIVRHSPCGA